MSDQSFTTIRNFAVHQSRLILFNNSAPFTTIQKRAGVQHKIYERYMEAPFTTM